MLRTLVESDRKKAKGLSPCGRPSILSAEAEEVCRCYTCLGKKL